MTNQQMLASRYLLADWFAHIAATEGMAFPQSGRSGDKLTFGAPGGREVSAQFTHKPPFLEFAAKDPADQATVSAIASKAIAKASAGSFGSEVWYSFDLLEPPFNMFSPHGMMSGLMLRLGTQQRIAGWRRLGGSVLLEFTEGMSTEANPDKPVPPRCEADPFRHFLTGVASIPRFTGLARIEIFGSDPRLVSSTRLVSVPVKTGRLPRPPTCMGAPSAGHAGTGDGSTRSRATMRCFSPPVARVVPCRRIHLMPVQLAPDPAPPKPASPAPVMTPTIVTRAEHTLEIVSDSGEGAQKCAQIIAAVSAKMGNGVWTVEIIPAEIQPPPRVPEGASGNRVRLGSTPVTNWGDETNLVVAFNEQVLLSRHRLHALADDCLILVEDRWATHDDERIRTQWSEAMDELGSRHYRIVPVPMEVECLTVVENARKGKNMFALGMVARIYARDLERIREQIAFAFRKKSEAVYEQNVKLLELGYAWAERHVDVRIDVPPIKDQGPMVVMNGNEALGMGAMASGMELCAMYPITPATSASHYLSEVFDRFGGIVHQAEDEIAAIGVAVGASYAGKVAFTITSGPGLALKTEFIGLAVMTETPLVLAVVQRGGPSTGLPTKVEQSDLLAALFGQPGDAPHVVLAPATIEECFHSMITARRIAEAFRMVVIVLSDANLATGQQPFPRPVAEPAWLAAPLDLSPVPSGAKPYDWDPRTGLSKRIIPGQPNGAFTLTGLAHDARSKVAYSADVHSHSSAMRSRKLAVLQHTLTPPTVFGPDEGDLLVVGWGSTKGAIEEAVERARKAGQQVSSLHLRFLSPLEPGLKRIFSRFKKVTTIEINYSDQPDAPFITDENRRRGQLAWLLRATTLVDVDCWTRIPGEPLRPGDILGGIMERMPNGGAA